MKPNIEFTDLRILDYSQTLAFQRSLFDPMVEEKFANLKRTSSDQVMVTNHLIFVEHPHVYTLGKSGNDQNLLIQDDLLTKIGASFHRIDRGGDITYHGPGQIVGYPIFDLEQFKMHIKQYIFALEQSIILTLMHFGIEAGRLDGATGVWIDPESHHARKICAIGVRARRHVTMHGFAFNVNTDLNYFQYINPCGFVDKGVTSMESELGCKQDFEHVKVILREKLISYFLDFSNL